MHQNQQNGTLNNLQNDIPYLTLPSKRAFRVTQFSAQVAHKWTSKNTFFTGKIHRFFARCDQTTQTTYTYRKIGVNITDSNLQVCVPWKRWNTCYSTWLADSLNISLL